MRSLNSTAAEESGRNQFRMGKGFGAGGVNTNVMIRPRSSSMHITSSQPGDVSDG